MITSLEVSKAMLSLVKSYRLHFSKVSKSRTALVDPVA